MDLETENRIAAILMKRAAELRRQAEKDGVHAYLYQPKVRGQPNSRFLSATVLGVQQANRAAEVNEMWRVRQKELELDDKLKRRLREGSSSCRSHRDLCDSPRSTTNRKTSQTAGAASYTSSKREIEECYSSEDGLRDEEVEEFLHSRVKRGRGAIGSRMDETGPYLPPSSVDSQGKLLVYPDDARVREDWEHRLLGPKKPPSLKSHKSSSDVKSDNGSWKEKRVKSLSSSKKQHSKKSRSKEMPRDSKKEKKCKHM